MTEDRAYAERLIRLESKNWKRWMDVQAPYRWNVRRLCPGRVLDVGCGIGRNLSHIDGRGVGVDHNKTAVAMARQRGFLAFTVEDFFESPDAHPKTFDTLLFAHVLEHLDGNQADTVVATYLPFLRPGGRVILITPQERGWRSDSTHVRWVGALELQQTVRALGLDHVGQFSFPLPRLMGRVFTHNEFVCVARKPVSQATL